MMVTKKLVNEARLHSHLTRLNMLAKASGTENKDFQKMFAAALDRTDTGKTLQRQSPYPFTQDVAAIEARKNQPVSDGSTESLEFRKILEVVLSNEGSRYVRKDGGEESSKYGVLQATANKYGYTGNVKNLSRADAEAIYKKIWEESGAGKLSYPLSLVHFDTYVNSPAAANKMLRTSNGDIDTYLKQRGQRYTRLAHLKPARYGKYLAGWMNRIKNLNEAVNEHKAGQDFAGSGIKPPWRS
jgi:hypothetical protein